MTALASALQRVWSAKNRRPRPTERGTSGSLHRVIARSGAYWACKLSELGALARRTAPTVVVIALRIFR